MTDKVVPINKSADQLKDTLDLITSILGQLTYAINTNELRLKELARAVDELQKAAVSSSD